MQKMIKMSLLAVAVAVSMTACQKDEPKAPVADKVELKTFEQQSAYAIGLSMGRYINSTLSRQQDLGVKLDNDMIMNGVKDGLAKKAQMSDADIEKALKAYDQKVNEAATKKAETDAKSSLEKGKKYLEENAKKAAASGYAWMPGPQFIADQAVIVDKAVSQADIVITTALIPGRNAPRLIKAETVAKMKAGSVILDMAVETGGNVEGSVLNQIVTTDNGVKIIGIPNIPAQLAAQSSALYANNVYNFAITLFNKEGQLVISLEDEIQKALLITQAGELLFNKK